MTQIIAQTIFIFFIAANLSFAENLYKLKQPDGSIIYSSKKASDGAEIAKLPKINHEHEQVSTDHSISKTVPANVDPTCLTHGGVSCEDGADLDGSVICADGYREASVRFNFSCRNTRLSVVNTLFTDLGSLKIIVRNERPVNAVDVEVLVRNRSENGVGYTLIKASGPEEIKGSQAGEYLLKYLNLNKKVESFPVDNIELHCGNCG